MRLALLLSLPVLVIAACSSDDSGETDASESAGADSDSVEVIRGWSDTLREGDVEGAADFFGLPTVAQNGTAPVELTTREDVIAFNEALPCGAELIDTESEGRLTIATFELTERPGPGSCGSGVGQTARTVFRIEDGKIFEWRRAPDELAPPPTDAPVV